MTELEAEKYLGKRVLVKSASCGAYGADGKTGTAIPKPSYDSSGYNGLYYDEPGIYVKLDKDGSIWNIGLDVKLEILEDEKDMILTTGTATFKNDKLDTKLASLYSSLCEPRMSVGAMDLELSSDGCGYSISFGRTPQKDKIVDINVIVPEKVVEVFFDDDLKEKMILHKDDTFNLRRCLFVAIAKHLYKKEYTPEGIEHKADELSYQKKYVKIVDDALKAYEKKCAEEKKAEEERKLQKARAAKKRAKRLARKERKKADYVATQIAIQKEAFVQAMKEVGENK